MFMTVNLVFQLKIRQFVLRTFMIVTIVGVPLSSVFNIS